MLVNIKNTDGDDFTIQDITDDITVGKLKELIETKTKTPKKHQMLVFNQKEIKNYDLLKEKNIKDKSTINLVFTSGICSGCEHCNPYKYESTGSGSNFGSFNVGY